MRKWISMVMMVAMVVSTTVPAASHASMNHDHKDKTAQSQTAAAPAAHDCDGHGKKAATDTHAKKDKPCCEQGMCKCLGGNCHSLSKIFGHSSDTLLASTVHRSEFAFANEAVASASPERLQRPPRA